ncbi:AAT-domain-containing protein [Aulographum hederae CBS 113979]|uniref:AAT-domain-containing protein n=1 Tax=Aulographum hederae CBS 113979 TaxID=1176131 RepID=A0A6G1GWT6_9PEZI|nr:AAT-domain-containing protein [Aulographum hederae CBS 113979]
MLEIKCSGTPYQIGFKHGNEAKVQIERCITFYAGQFKKNAKLDWSEVKPTALQFEPIIKSKWPAFLEEMQGIADGAGVDLASVIAINVRTEITFGLFTDGCTALSWHNNRNSFLAQNWDWMPEQKQNLINLCIAQPRKPTIKMITEAGLIGKIGLNSLGVGVCLNAIRAKGMDPHRMPCHLALRTVLESPSRSAAVAALESSGVASSCHMLIADADGATGMEWSSTGCAKLEMDGKGRVFHTNHLLLPQEGVEDTTYLPDSFPRIERIHELADKVEEPSVQGLKQMLRDEKGLPGSICRKEADGSIAETLFSIVMDLKGKNAVVVLGRPVEPEEEFELRF